MFKDVQEKMKWIGEQMQIDSKEGEYMKKKTSQNAIIKNGNIWKKKPK